MFLILNRTNRTKMQPIGPITRAQFYLLISLVLAHVAQAATTDDPNEVTYVDFLARANSQRHHTSRYETGGRFMVLRRGEIFEFNIMMSRPFDELKDKLRLEFCFGRYPSRDDGSLIYVPLVTLSKAANMSRIKWDARIVTIERRLIQVRTNLPPNIPVGTWRLQISSKVAQADLIQTFKIRDTFHIIFNAWNEYDDVHMPDDNWRQEYLMNEVGQIYVGSYSLPQGRKWTYGQFDQSVLSTVLYLLDKTRLSVSERADVVKTSRAVSAIVNSHDEGGLLVGNWSGNYMDGLSPWQWTGSAVIFRKYVQDGYRSVKFGQCWVFGGSTTATLRTLGIPARTISNFNSAHDTDSSLSVDKFYSGMGAELSDVNGDSIWNFHVWSDAWMKRRDLPEGFDGWQAIDATPQEQSMGAYQLGPASLEAIKQGRTGWAYDVGFVFSEVNADVVNWRPDDRSKLRWYKSHVDYMHVGRKILTKMVGKLDPENIINQYKYPEGSAEARKAYAEAARSSGVQPLFDHHSK